MIENLTSHTMQLLPGLPYFNCPLSKVRTR